MKNRAFTLAEVLITLGIIGIIAALPIPGVLKNYRNQVVISRLQKLSATFGQAYSMATANYGTDQREAFIADNPDIAMEMFDKYYTPYIKFSKIEKGDKGVFAYLTDGTAIYFRRNYYTSEKPDGWYNTYIFACIDYKACEEFDETNIEKNIGRKVFTLYTNGQAPSYTWNTYKDRSLVLKDCKNHTGFEACSALIVGDGWKIKNDYPFKL